MTDFVTGSIRGDQPEWDERALLNYRQKIFVAHLIPCSTRISWANRSLTSILQLYSRFHGRARLLSIERIGEGEKIGSPGGKKNRFGGRNVIQTIFSFAVRFFSFSPYMFCQNYA